MARRPNTRSPSPTGNRRDNQPIRRDRRNPSPDRERDKRYRGRDDRRQSNRSPDRRDSFYRPNDRRDRSRDRRRSRSPLGRDRRNRSRDRDFRDRRDDYRDRRDDSRDRARRREEPDRRRRDSRERSQRESSVRASDSPATPSNSKAAEDEKKKAERLAKLQAWKEKQAAEKAKKAKEAAASSGAQASLPKADKKQTESPITSSPKSPGVDATDATDAGAQESPKPYAGKFDPKAIAQKVHSTKHGPTALGTDVAVPVSQASAKQAFNTGLKAKQTSTDPNLKAGAVRPLKKGGNLSAFGIANKTATETTGQKRALDLEEEVSTRKKLEKLPSPPPEDDIRDDAAHANGADEEDDDADMDEGGTEEEVAAAARAAAIQREERLQAQNAAENATNGDTSMSDAPITTQANTSMEVDEDIDPLDAFMNSMGDPLADAPKKHKTLAKQPKLQEPQAFLSDDEKDLEAVGTTQEDILAIASKKKKRDIPTVNHAKMDYEPFRKSFFTEPKEHVDLKEEDVANIRFELDGIKVRGVDVPTPVNKWAQCGLSVPILEAIRNLKYEAPTPIQAQAIPAIMSGRDVIGVAKTGSGKTIAFLLPMFRHIKDQRRLESMEGPIGLIMSPTRELATQIHRECKPFLKALDLRAVCAYGGAPIKDQIAELKRGAEIVVCTPGRMIDLLAANSGRVTNLRRATYIVLDEADRMFDMGFEPQVMKILANVRPGRQTVLFSATFPRNMEALARKALIKPVEITVGGRSTVAPEIKQIIEVRPENTKFLRTLELLGELFESDDDARVLIFVDRQDSADGLLNELMKKAYPCNSIHGGKDQLDRNEVINDFKAGVIPIMIATSVAARGLDVKQLKLVINYDTPNHMEDYVHRAGRTGRAGNTGTCVTFITEEQERYAVDLTKALKLSGQEAPEPLQKLAAGFREKVKAGKEKASGSGFGGHGLDKFDAQREAKLKAERGMHKDKLGEDVEDEDKKEDKKKELEPVVIKSSDAAPSTAPPPASSAIAGIDLTSNLVIHKRETPAPSASSNNNQMDKVRQAVEAISGRLNLPNTTRPGHPIDNKGPDAGAYHTTLEINDFPQKARWAVTNRTNVAKILDATGTSITTKGNFYATGKTPGPGDAPKLYILIEGDTELVVTQAVRELQRLLVEGATAAANSEARAPVSGRYSVV